MTYSVLRGMMFVCLFAGFFLFPEEALAAEELRYRLKWLYNTSVVGDLYAEDQGYFARQGLQVEVRAGGPEKDAIREVELGHAQFGVASADQVIRALAKGSPVVVLAQLYQVNPLQWIYRASQPPIRQVADLRGRVIGITYGGNDETIMRALLASAGIAPGAVTLLGVRHDFTPFYQGRADIWPVYRNSQGPILARKLREAGEEVLFFNPAEFGVHFVANSVITSERMLATRPDTVRRFVLALLAGWRDALDPANTAQALGTLRRFDRDTPDDLREQELALTREMIRPRPEIPIGAIDAGAWRQTEAILRTQGLVPQAVDIASRLRPQQE